MQNDNNNLRKILDLKNEILAEAKSRNIILRLTGGIAFLVHCPEEFRYLYNHYSRSFPDIDFAARLKQVVEIQKLFLDLGFEENRSVMRLFGTQRRIFEFPGNHFHIDIFLDRLFFCHNIDIRDRLSIDYPTLPLADLLLSKLQIVQMNSKDLLDCLVILEAHDVGDSDKETVNTPYISRLCSRNWGLWRTVTKNLEKVRDVAEDYIKSIPTNMEAVICKIDTILREIDNQKKFLAWELRNVVGEKIKWYNDVEELNRA